MLRPGGRFSRRLWRKANSIGNTKPKLHRQHNSNCKSEPRQSRQAKLKPEHQYPVCSRPRKHKERALRSKKSKHSSNGNRDQEQSRKHKHKEAEEKLLICRQVIGTDLICFGTATIP